MKKAKIHHHLIITTLQKGIFCPFSGLASFLPMLLLLFLFARFFLQLLLGDNIFFLCVANVANVRLERKLLSCLLWRSPVGWILTFWRKSGPCLFYIDENPSQLHISCWYTWFGLPRFLHVKALKLKKSQKHFWRSRQISFHRQKICFPSLKQPLVLINRHPTCAGIHHCLTYLDHYHRYDHRNYTNTLPYIWLIMFI